MLSTRISRSLILLLLLSTFFFEDTRTASQVGQASQKPSPPSQPGSKDVLELTGTLVYSDVGKHEFTLRAPANQKYRWGDYPENNKTSKTSEGNTLHLPLPSTTQVVNMNGQALEFSNLKPGEPLSVELKLNPDGEFQVLKVVAQIACTPDFCAVGKCKQKCGVKPCQCNRK